MMIEAANIRKFRGRREILRGVSFAVAKGETVGFLGVNGAGKSTAIRILAGLFAPDSGLVRIAGRDPLDPGARRAFGYLPETNPLPPDMRVGEYLVFRARLKGLPRRRSWTVAQEATERCNLEEVWKRPIGRLSKGYRQMTGLADAILGLPPILMLDEPTSGLDPARAAKARDLIKELGASSTILFSSHILEDVETLCPRVVVIDRGVIAADGATADICGKCLNERIVCMEIIADEPVEEALKAIPGVRGVTAAGTPPDSPVSVRVTMPAGLDLRRELSALCAGRGWLVTEIHLEPARLEDLFRRLSGDGNVQDPDRRPAGAEKG